MCDVRCSLFVIVCCFGVRYLMLYARCVYGDCLLFVVCCLLSLVVCRVLCVVCCVLSVVVRCWVFGVR